MAHVLGPDVAVAQRSPAVSDALIELMAVPTGPPTQVEDAFRLRSC